MDILGDQAQDYSQWSSPSLGIICKANDQMDICYLLRQDI